MVGVWERPTAYHTPGVYVMIQEVTKSTLEAPTRPHVLRILEPRPRGAVQLEGSDEARCRENAAHYPLPTMDTQLYPEDIIRGFQCIVETVDSKIADPRWCSMTHARRGIKSSAWTNSF